jgi:O-methyltransferase involved in polyketide biosynthesis
MSHDAFKTYLGRSLYFAMLPLNILYRIASNQADVNLTLLARHLIIDHLLDQAICSGKIHQVVEIAAGLSPRGMHFSRRYPEITYVEGDLPEMIATKSRLLDSAEARRPNHHIISINALAETGPESLGAATEHILDKGKGIALITEGLTGYLSPEELEGMWERFSKFLSNFPIGIYYTDISFLSHSGKSMDAFKLFLEWFSKGQTYLHYSGFQECASRLRGMGFSDIQVHDPKDFSHIGVKDPHRNYLSRVVEAVKVVQSSESKIG